MRQAGGHRVMGQAGDQGAMGQTGYRSSVGVGDGGGANSGTSHM